MTALKFVVIFDLTCKPHIFIVSKYLLITLTSFRLFSFAFLSFYMKWFFCYAFHKIISQVTHLEEESKLPLWTMMPPAVVYNCLFSRNICFLARACDLLLKYDTTLYPRLRALGLRTKFMKEVSQQQLYVADFMSCLWNQNVSNLFWLKISSVI